MKKAFTLIELLVVIAIMGILGTASVGGYRAMQRGMEERGVMQNVNQLIRLAYQRCQIDRQPVLVYFWNETMREESETETLRVVGKALAVRRYGRLSNVQGSYLVDEFGDFKSARYIENEDEDDGGVTESSYTPSGDAAGSVWLYKVNGDESSLQRSAVSQTSVAKSKNEYIPALGESQSIEAYAYLVTDKNGVTWKKGDAYGFVFAELTLPDNYIFGSSFSRSIASPVKEAGHMMFSPKETAGDGAITVSNLRPDASGALAPATVAASSDPTKKLSETKKQ